MKSVLALLVTTAFVLSGCSVGQQSVLKEKALFPNPQLVLQAVDPVTDPEQVFQSTAKVSVICPGRKMIFRLAVITQPPDRIRIETIPVFGPPDFFFATRNGRFQVYLPISREFITGSATADNLARALPLSLPWPARRWVAVLQGRPDISVDEKEFQGNPEGSFYRIDAVSGNTSSERFWINMETRHLEKMEFIDRKGQKNTIIYSLFKEFGGKDIPSNIEIDTDNETKIHIVFETLETKKEYNADLFSLLAPPDVDIKTLSD